jgi:hypothetical protein
MRLNDSPNKVHIYKQLFDPFSVYSNLTKWGALSLLLVTFTLEIAIWLVQETQYAQELDPTH